MGGEPGFTLQPVPGGHGGHGGSGGTLQQVPGPLPLHVEAPGGRAPQRLRHQARLPELGSSANVGKHWWKVSLLHRHRLVHSACIIMLSHPHPLAQRSRPSYHWPTAEALRQARHVLLCWLHSVRPAAPRHCGSTLGIGGEPPWKPMHVQHDMVLPRHVLLKKHAPQLARFGL